MELHVTAAFAAASAAKHVQDFHLIPLFSRNKDACPLRKPDRVAHLPQKPDVIFNFLPRLAIPNIDFLYIKYHLNVLSS